MRADLIGEHSKTFNSVVRVVDSEGSRLGNIQVPVVISHAVPELEQTVTPEVPVFFESGTVTIDASQSTDKDGPNGLPTKYEFVFDPNDENETVTQVYSSYFDENGDEIQTGYGIASHEYSAVGYYPVAVRAYNDDYQTCSEASSVPNPHIAEEVVEVKVFGCDNPTIKAPEIVDDGNFPGYSWGNLGDPCISVAVNPWTRQPGIAYTAKFASRTAVICCAMFIERDVRGIWPGSPSWVKSAEPPTQSTGWQIDLEYDPLWYGMHLNKSNILEPFVTRYIAVTYGDASVGGTNGIYHFLTTEDEFRNITWTKTALITSNLINPSINISHLQPIRMISVNDVNPGQLTYGQFVHFSGSYERPRNLGDSKRWIFVGCGKNDPTPICARFQGLRG